MRPGTRMTAAHSLRQPLERLYREFDYSARVELDAIRFPLRARDRKSTRLNSSHLVISYAVFCLKKKKDHSHTSDTPHQLLHVVRRRQVTPSLRHEVLHH